MQATHVSTLILPLVGSLEKWLDAEKSAGITLEFANTALGGAAFSAQLKALPAPHKAHFNPVNFVKAGEMPFLRSYGTGRFIRTMTSLDVNDALWDGTPRRLAQGNAEIKELVSIVRCRNFAGTLVLGGGAPCATDARQFCQDFRNLLETI